MDNLEHLTEPGRLLVDFLLNNTEEIKILTTTRERLDLHGEWLMEIAGLPVSESDSENTALSLFERRGKRLIPEFALVDDSSHDSTPNCSSQDAARICRLVDGLPLGIEMAASWVRLLTCGEIAHEIENNLDFLQQRSPGTPGRHRSLRAVFDYSWGYLQAPAQETLGQLSVFCGVFDRRAAEQITGANLSQLKTLTDHALLRRDEHASTGGSQYELLSVVRQYAQQKLEQTDGPAANQLRDRHASYYLQHLAGQYEALIGPEQQETLSELSSRSDNLRTAWQWAVDHGHYEEIAQAANTLGLLYYMRSWFALGVEAFTLAANRLSNMKLQEQDHLLLAQLSGWQGWFLFLIGESRQGRELLTRSVGTFGQDSGGVSPLMLSLCATVTAELGDDSSGWRLAQDALDNGKAQKDNYSMAVANNVLSQISFERGDFSAARNYGWASLELERAIGNQWSMGFSLANMGRASLALGHFRKAEERFFHSLAIRRKLGDVRGRALCRMYLGDTTAAMNDLGRAQSNYEASLGLFRQIGNRSGLAAVHIRLGRITIRESRGEVESEHHLLVALHNAQLAESTPLMLEAIGELATERARKSPEQASTLAQLILAHRSAPTPVREQAASLLAALGNGQDPNNEYADEDGLAQQLLSTVDYLLSDLDSEH